MARDTLDLGSWCILRMASVDTIPLHKALLKRGYNVWTPIEHRIGRMPRTRKEYEKDFPMMPSYVFAHVDCMDDILRLAVLPTSDIPRFTMFRHQQGFPLIADIELEGLRFQEDRLKAIYDKRQAAKIKPPVFDEGTEVQFSDGGFEGLSGRVIESKGRYTLVDIRGFAEPIKISSLLLAKDIREERSKAA